MKYSKKLGKAVADQYATGGQSITAICEAAHITKDTFFRWKKVNSEFSELINDATELRMQSLGEMALTGLALLLTKHEYTEVQTEYSLTRAGVRKLKSEKIIKKTAMPHAGNIQYVLNNRLPEQWKNASKLTFVDETEKLIDKLDDQQLQIVIQALLDKSSN